MLKIAILLIFLFFPSFAATAETLKFAPLPMESPTTVAGQWKPLLDHLEQELGVDLEISYSTNNREILEMFAAGQIDLAYMDPLHYLLLKDRFPAAEPVVVFHEADGKPTCTCALVVAGDSGLSLGQVKGLKIALTQAVSTCGYFSIDSLLHQSGICLEENRYRYLGPHDDVALAVAAGEFDTGGLKTAIARKYATLGMRVIAETAPLPGLALIANGERVSSRRIEDIRRALLDADESVRRAWGDNLRHGASVIRDQDYDGARRLPYKTAISERSNF